MEELQFFLFYLQGLDLAIKKALSQHVLLNTAVIKGYLIKNMLLNMQHILAFDLSPDNFGSPRKKALANPERTAYISQGMDILLL